MPRSLKWKLKFLVLAINDIQIEVYIISPGSKLFSNLTQMWIHVYIIYNIDSTMNGFI